MTDVQTMTSKPEGSSTSMAAPETRNLETVTDNAAPDGKTTTTTADFQVTAGRIFEDIRVKLIELAEMIQRDLPPQDEMAHMLKEAVGTVEMTVGRAMKNMEQHGAQLVEKARAERAQHGDHKTEA